MRIGSLFRRNKIYSLGYNQTTLTSTDNVKVIQVTFDPSLAFEAYMSEQK